MKPLSEEELDKAAWEDYLDAPDYDGDEIKAHMCGFKRGYAKCVKQMSDEFNEMLKACNMAIKNQAGVIPQELLNQLKGANNEEDRELLS